MAKETSAPLLTGLQIAHEPLRINPPEERGSEGGSQCGAADRLSLL